jgi:hypothetical protein
VPSPGSVRWLGGGEARGGGASCVVDAGRRCSALLGITESGDEAAGPSVSSDRCRWCRALSRGVGRLVGRWRACSSVAMSRLGQLGFIISGHAYGQNMGRRLPAGGSVADSVFALAGVARSDRRQRGRVLAQVRGAGALHPWSAVVSGRSLSGGSALAGVATGDVRQRGLLVSRPGPRLGTRGGLPSAGSGAAGSVCAGARAGVGRIRAGPCGVGPTGRWTENDLSDV